MPLIYRSDNLLQALRVLELLVDTTLWDLSASDLQVEYPALGSDCP